MTPEDVRAALAASSEPEALRRVVQACAARLRDPHDDDHIGLVVELLPLVEHPHEMVRRAVADACDVFPGHLFEEVHRALAADVDHFVCAAARRAGDRRAARRKVAKRTDDAAHLTAEIASQIEARHGKGALQLARRLAKREVEQFLERMSHEVQKIDGAIDHALEGLIAEAEKPDASLATLRARSSALRERVTFQRVLLQRAREYARRVTPVFAPDLVAPIVVEAREQLLSRMGARGERLRFEADVPASLGMHADRHALLQALQNLLQNAVEAYPPDAERLTVRVIARALRRGTEIEIRVEDDGAGMSDAVKAGLFVPFRTSKPGGTGVGLVTARKMIEDVHGGTLAVESARGAGTRVVLTLPARQAGVKERA